MRYKKIQLIYKINCNLSVYRKKTENNQWDFPDFTDKCPICHGKDCAVKHGFYLRLIIDLENKFFFFILIARYKCRRKQKPRNNLVDKTFSLLPHLLIPYISLTIDSFMLIIANHVIKKLSAFELQEILDNYHIDEERLYNIDIRHFKLYSNIFIETLFKLNQFIEKHKIRAGPFSGSKNMNNAYIFLKNYKSGFPDFSVYYYQKEGGALKNAQFLYGRPYQSYSF